MEPCLYAVICYLCILYVLLCLFLLFPARRWWGVCAQKGSVGCSVGTFQTCVKATPVSEGWSASRSQSLASSPVESVLKIPSLRGNRVTSALCRVGGPKMTVVWIVCMFFCSHIIRFGKNNIISISGICVSSQTCAALLFPSPAIKMRPAASINKTIPAHAS